MRVTRRRRRRGRVYIYIIYTRYGGSGSSSIKVYPRAAQRLYLLPPFYIYPTRFCLLDEISFLAIIDSASGASNQLIAKEYTPRYAGLAREQRFCSRKSADDSDAGGSTCGCYNRVIDVEFQGFFSLFLSRDDSAVKVYLIGGEFKAFAERPSRSLGPISYWRRVKFNYIGEYFGEG